MTRDEALDIISDGHRFIAVETAREAAEALGVEFKETLIERYANQQEANPDNNPKGLWLNEPDKAVEGVATLRLSSSVVSQLGLQVRGFMGRGFQARANAEAVRKHLEPKAGDEGMGELPEIAEAMRIPTASGAVATQKLAGRRN